jgi:GDP-D-mannose 3',5'-epimerase
MNVIKNQAHYGKVFFPSSAWVYPKHVEQCSEAMAYPPNPASIYGWEKLIGEMLYGALGRKAVVARTHNVYGPGSPFQGIKALAPAALCHQAITTPEGGTIKIYGSGFQERSFLYVEDYVDCVIKLMRSDCQEVVNIGSEESISILDLALKVIEISGKDIRVVLGSETVEVARRFSDNGILERYVDWEPKTLIRDGLQKTYDYVRSVCAA